MRPGTLRSYTLGVLTGTAITATSVALAPAAKADITDTDILDYGGPVCAVLDDGYNTTDGILGIGRAIMDDGYTAREAGQIIGVAIRDLCPQYIPLLRRFITLYGGTPQQAIA